MSQEAADLPEKESSYQWLGDLALAIANCSYNPPNGEKPTFEVHYFPPCYWSENCWEITLVPQDGEPSVNVQKILALFDGTQKIDYEAPELIFHGKKNDQEIRVTIYLKPGSAALFNEIRWDADCKTYLWLR